MKKSVPLTTINLEYKNLSDLVDEVDNLKQQYSEYKNLYLRYEYHYEYDNNKYWVVYGEREETDAEKSEREAQTAKHRAEYLKHARKVLREAGEL